MEGNEIVNLTKSAVSFKAHMQTWLLLIRLPGLSSQFHPMQVHAKVLNCRKMRLEGNPGDDLVQLPVSYQNQLCLFVNT